MAKLCQKETQCTTKSHLAVSRINGGSPSVGSSVSGLVLRSLSWFCGPLVGSAVLRSLCRFCSPLVPLYLGWFRSSSIGFAIPWSVPGSLGRIWGPAVGSSVLRSVPRSLGQFRGPSVNSVVPRSVPRSLGQFPSPTVAPGSRSWFLGFTVPWLV